MEYFRKIQLHFSSFNVFNKIARNKVLKSRVKPFTILTKVFYVIVKFEVRVDLVYFRRLVKCRFNVALNFGDKNQLVDRFLCFFCSLLISLRFSLFSLFAPFYFFNSFFLIEKNKEEIKSMRNKKPNIHRSFQRIHSNCFFDLIDL